MEGGSFVACSLHETVAVCTRQLLSARDSCCLIIQQTTSFCGLAGGAGARLQLRESLRELAPPLLQVCDDPPRRRDARLPLGGRLREQTLARRGWTSTRLRLNRTVEARKRTSSTPVTQNSKVMRTNRKREGQGRHLRHRVVLALGPHTCGRRDETCPISTGGRDAARPDSTGGGGPISSCTACSSSAYSPRHSPTCAGTGSAPTATTLQTTLQTTVCEAVCKVSRHTPSIPLDGRRVSHGRGRGTCASSFWCSLWHSSSRACSTSTLRTKVSSRVSAGTRAAAQCVRCSGVSSSARSACAPGAPQGEAGGGGGSD